MTESTTEEQGGLPKVSSPQEEALKLVTWLDLVIYLIGGVGLYFLAGVALSLVFNEINLAVTVLSGVLNFVALGGATYFLGVRRGKISWESLGLTSRENWGRDAMIGSVLAVGLLLPRSIAGLVGLGIEYLITGEASSLEMRTELFSVGFDTWYGALLMLIGIGILAPIAEELFFRGLLYDFFRRKTGVRYAVVISSVLFGLAHFDSLAVGLSAFVMGVVMAMTVEWTGSIRMSIYMHIATNSGAVMLMAVMMQLEPYLTSQGF